MSAGEVRHHSTASTGHVNGGKVATEGDLIVVELDSECCGLDGCPTCVMDSRVEPEKGKVAHVTAWWHPLGDDGRTADGPPRR